MRAGRILFAGPAIFVIWMMQSDARRLHPFPGAKTRIGGKPSCRSGIRVSLACLRHKPNRG